MIILIENILHCDSNNLVFYTDMRNYLLHFPPNTILEYSYNVLHYVNYYYFCLNQFLIQKVVSLTTNDHSYYLYNRFQFFLKLQFYP